MAESASSDAPSSAAPSRRAVVSGALWSVPAVSVATAAPSFATTPGGGGAQRKVEFDRGASGVVAPGGDNEALVLGGSVLVTGAIPGDGLTMEVSLEGRGYPYDDLFASMPSVVGSWTRTSTTAGPYGIPLRAEWQLAAGVLAAAPEVATSDGPQKVVPVAGEFGRPYMTRRPGTFVVSFELNGDSQVTERFPRPW